VSELRGGALTETDVLKWSLLEARVTHLEHLLNVAVEVVAKTNGLQADQIRFMLECDVEDRYGSDSDGDDDPSASPRPTPPEGRWPRTSSTPVPAPSAPSSPSFQVLLGGRT
jgi:hypothetical protein